MVAMNSLAPHVEKGTKLTLDQFLIQYGEQPEPDELIEGEIGESAVWFDSSVFQYSPEQIPINSELG